MKLSKFEKEATEKYNFDNGLIKDLDVALNTLRVHGEKSTRAIDISIREQAVRIFLDRKRNTE